MGLKKLLLSSITFLLFQIASPQARDLFQNPIDISECDWATLASAVNPAGYRLYAQEALMEFEGKTVEDAQVALTDVPQINDTTADRLENKSWARLDQIDSTLEQLREKFPQFGLRDGGASNVRSDYYRTFHAAVYVDEKTGLLVAAGENPTALQKNSARFSRRVTAMKLRVRKYDGSALTAGSSKIELKFRSPIAGKIDKPSVLFRDQDVALLLGTQAPDAETYAAISERTKALVDGRGKLVNRKADQVDEIMTVVSQMRILHEKAGYPFEPIVHIGYLRHAYAIPFQDQAGKFELQFTRDSDLFVMKPQIMPRIIHPAEAISPEVIGRAPSDIGVLEDKTPLSKTGISPVTKRFDPARQQSVEQAHPELHAVREILSPLQKAVEGTPYQLNRGKRYHFGHGLFAEPASIEDQADRVFNDPTE